MRGGGGVGGGDTHTECIREEVTEIVVQELGKCEKYSGYAVFLVDGSGGNTFKVCYCYLVTFFVVQSHVRRCKRE